MSTTDAAWSGLVRAALLGTDRADAGAASPAINAEPRLAALVAALGERNPEARLLGAAAALAQYRRVGELAGAALEPPPAPAPSEASRRCPAGAVSHLRLMLDGEHDEALPEWLGRLVEKGFVVAAEDLPRLLDAGRNQPLLRELIVAAAGERGRWLATYNPAWSYAVSAAADDATWETGTTEARLVLLRRLRGRDPARALELLRSTWATEPPQQRALFLAALEIGLGMADEAFLEEALDDRRKEVRGIAAGLLARLPASRLVARMTERVRPLVRMPSRAGALARALGRLRIEVDLPAACDAALIRDGIEPKPPRGTGERAWWLAQMLAAVPPSLWSGEARLTPDQCIGAAERSEFRELLVQAWSTAAGRAGDAAWASALLTAWAYGERRIEPGPLARALPREQLEAVIIRLVEAADGEPSAAEPGLALAAEARHAWSPALTRAVMTRLAHLPATLDYALRALLAALAARMHPATAVAEAVRGGDTPRGAWLDLLHHRHNMLEALER